MSGPSWLPTRQLLFVLVIVMVLAGCGDTPNGLSVGDPAPDFTLPDAAGSTVSLDVYSGAPALLYFHMADG